MGRISFFFLVTHCSFVTYKLGILSSAKKNRKETTTLRSFKGQFPPENRNWPNYESLSFIIYSVYSLLLLRSLRRLSSYEDKTTKNINQGAFLVVDDRFLGSGPEGADDLCFHTGQISPPPPPSSPYVDPLRSSYPSLEA